MIHDLILPVLKRNVETLRAGTARAQLMIVNLTLA